ncbi:Putative Tle1 phospholipase, alpha/Beta hydrolase [Colletotrichum destructivum]|uniref:Tle1 phospholipase, alpha/Beta hydrolase n=1 Tax=Colletotrichum destructivum TaxID=34406 RepID=A0AAX4HYL7_9PEZI|nr:Putative Tle1 phospholipase, alpha/Beta hydrolase [Colletotrichum destructivum]
MATPPTPMKYSPKRLVVCCDGTWMNSESAYVKPTFWKPKGSLQIPSNVTRISRCFRRRCSDGRVQVIEYESGVGTGSNTLDTLTGGAFGIGLGERVRNIYSFLCANYCDGDEIVLVGFSRGAYIVRCVAGMIADLGLLTREGVEHFWPIFKDMENWNNHRYRDEFPTVPFDNKPKGEGAADVYRSRLEKLGMTRVRQEEGTGDIIKVKAVAVWDTVGSLGIPQIAWLNRLGIYASNQEFKFWDTSLSDRVEHAFQALALDETRYSFQPAVWERLEANKLSTDLRQVWFPGNHSNCGGGWNDQGMANITLAWMMDQLASIGVEFNHRALERCVEQSNTFYAELLKPKSTLKWATEPIYSQNHPLRPWGLGAIQKTPSLLYSLAGKITRSPGLYRQANAHTEALSGPFLKDTNERIHSSVRIRLACKGLGLNDVGVWDNPALKKNWKLVRKKAQYHDPVPNHPSWEPEEDRQECMEHPSQSDDGRWVWEYCGPDEKAPTSASARVMVEEPLGPYERHLLKLTGGNPNVYQNNHEKAR